MKRDGMILSNCEKCRRMLGVPKKDYLEVDSNKSFQVKCPYCKQYIVKRGMKEIFEEIDNGY